MYELDYNWSWGFVGRNVCLNLDVHIGQLKLAVKIIYVILYKQIIIIIILKYFIFCSYKFYRKSDKDGRTCKNIVFSSISKESYGIFYKRGKETKFR